jgi:hypothetical protein
MIDENEYDDLQEFRVPHPPLVLVLGLMVCVVGVVMATSVVSDLLVR